MDVLMMRHLCNFATVLFLISFPASAFSASNEPGSNPLSNTGSCCFSARVNIVDHSDMKKKTHWLASGVSANMEMLQAPVLSPGAQTTGSQTVDAGILLKSNSTAMRPIPRPHSVDRSIIRSDSAADSQSAMPSAESGEAESFDPNFVVSSGSNDGATNDRSMSGRTPAFALLALAVIGMAAVSRRTGGIFPSNKV
jgi:hypothetical protein